MPEQITLNDVVIDIRKVELMLKKIIMREKVNLKTREMTDAQMVQVIKNLIEEEVKCY